MLLRGSSEASRSSEAIRSSAALRSRVQVLTAHCEANPTATVGTTSLAELVALLPTAETLAGLVWTPPTAEDVAAAAQNYAAMLPDLTESVGAESLAPERCKPAGTYSESELDVLALMYTGVKILYVAGALQLLPPLIKVCAPQLVAFFMPICARAASAPLARRQLACVSLFMPFHP